MWKIAAFNCREDELGYFKEYGKKYGVEMVLSGKTPVPETIDIAKGCQGVSVITTPITAEILEKFHEYGVKVVSTRTVGYEHIDYRRAAELGIVVSNVSYTPHTVAEYAVMSILMVLRKMKTIMTRYMGQDYSLAGVRGRELCHQTVGVIGTGRIGETVIQNLSGFGCRILAYDLHEKETVKAYAEYASLEHIWKECDVITLHAPATEESFHMINADTIRQMKDGVVIVNTARGLLIDTDALIQGLVEGKIGAAALDVIENEGKIYYKDFKYEIVNHTQMTVLNAMPNVLMTPHTAFFTDEAVGNMVEYSIKSCIQTIEGNENPWKINEEIIK